MSPTVLVVGAGPTGLTLACALQKLGVPCRIIDKKDAPATTSRAIGTHARTLEIFEAMGVLPPILAGGHPATGANVYVGRERLVHLALNRLEDVPYPFILMMAQADTERVLRDRLGALGGAVAWGTELIDVHQRAGAVSARVRRADGIEERIESRFLVSAEGAHSVVRKLLHVPFEGSAYASEFLLMDAKVAWDRSHEQTAVWLHPEGIFAILPLPGKDEWRLFAAVTPAPGQSAPVASLPVMQALLDQRTESTEARITEPTWMSNFRISKRLIARYRVGSVFFAGDAAHIHSPFGGQGMNTGIGDAWNLAWKLARVVEGRAGDALLDSYEAERRPVARRVIAQTDSSMQVLLSQSPWMRLLRQRLLAPLMARESVQRRLAREVSQLDVSYRSRAFLDVQLHLKRPSRVLTAGDRMPDGAVRAPLAGGSGGAASRLFSHLDGTTFTAVLFPRGPLAALRPELTAMARLPSVRVVCADAGSDLRARAGMDGGGMCLVRPDGYLGLVTREITARAVEDYLSRLLASPPRS